MSPDVGPINPGSQRQTQELLVLTQPKKLGPDAGLKRLDPNEGSIILGQTGMQDLRDLSLRLATPKILGWGTLSCPKFLGFGKECLTQEEIKKKLLMGPARGKTQRWWIMLRTWPKANGSSGGWTQSYFEVNTQLNIFLLGVVAQLHPISIYLKIKLKKYKNIKNINLKLRKQ